jgi:HK97 family phage portal protein
MRLNLGGFEVSLRRKAAPGLRPVGGRAPRGWSATVIREPYMGAWQENASVLAGSSSLANGAAYACVTLIASDIGKLPLLLVEQDAERIWQETTNPAYSPVLRRPNRYQTTIKFIEQWISSKLIYGNTYVLKERDSRGVVKALYVLDPQRVTPLVAPDGSVYYELKRDDLSGAAMTSPVIVPQAEIIHDLMVALFHPLVGVSPLYACGLAAQQGLNIQEASSNFFAKGSRPGGILTAPGEMSDEDMLTLKERFERDFSGDNAGRLLAVSGGLTYHALSIPATDAQLIEQLRWSSETVCSCYHVPPFKVGVGPYPTVGNVEALNQQYYSDCLQALITSFEAALEDGIGLAGTGYGVALDIDDLIWLDTATRTKAAHDAIGSGAMAPNEARKTYFGLGSVKGGDSPYMQEQNYSLEALAERDANKPFNKPAPGVPAVAPADTEADEVKALAAFTVALTRKDWAGLADGV